MYNIFNITLDMNVAWLTARGPLRREAAVAHVACSTSQLGGNVFPEDVALRTTALVETLSLGTEGTELYFKPIAA